MDYTTYTEFCKTETAKDQNVMDNGLKVSETTELESGFELKPANALTSLPSRSTTDAYYIESGRQVPLYSTV